MSLYVVSDEDNLYEERVGSLVWETSNCVKLDLGDDTVIFFKTQVTQIL